MKEACCYPYFFIEEASSKRRQDRSWIGGMKRQEMCTELLQNAQVPWLSLQVSLDTGLIFPCFLAPGRKVKVLILPSRSRHRISFLFQTPTFVEAGVPCFVVVRWPLSFSLETQVPARGVAFLPYSCPISGWPHKLPGCPSQCPRLPSSSSQ